MAVEGEVGRSIEAQDGHGVGNESEERLNSLWNEHRGLINLQIGGGHAILPHEVLDGQAHQATTAATSHEALKKSRTSKKSEHFPYIRFRDMFGRF